MLKLVSFQNQHFFNDTSLSKKISELFYEKGFPFSQTIIAKPDDLQKIKTQAVSDNENYYVFINPAEYVIGKNVRSIKEIALEKDCLAVIN